MEELQNDVAQFIKSILEYECGYRTKYKENGWELDFTIASERKEIKHRCTLISMMQEWSTYDYIASAVESKHPNNYKLQNKPFIIAINIHPVNSVPQDNDMIVRTVFGKSIDVAEFKTTYYSDGIFCTYKKDAKTFVKDNEEISGLLIIVNLDSKSITNKKATLYINPWSINPIPYDILPIDTVYYSEDKKGFHTVKGKSTRELFEL